jgi:hypothetical protein
VTGVSYGIKIHVLAKDQYPRYRSPARVGAEAFDEGRILGRYQSAKDQIKGTARAKLGPSYLKFKRVALPWSRTSRVVYDVTRGGRAWSWVRFVIETRREERATGGAAIADPYRHNDDREMMLFIGTRFSNLCTAVHTPA